MSFSSDPVSSKVKPFVDDELDVAVTPSRNLASLHSPVLRDHFPFAKFLPSQEKATAVVEKWLPAPQKFMLYEGPTGSGKSGLCIMAASYAKTMPGCDLYKPGSYILTPQKSLAEQYMKDFQSMGLVELKGRNNYPCDKWTRRTEQDADCEVGATMNESADEHCDACPYRAAKAIFMGNAFGTTNFDYYLNEINHSHQLSDRTLLVLDEGHNTEDKILGLTDTVITKERCKKYGIPALPIFAAGDTSKVLSWLDKVFVPAAEKFASELGKKYKAVPDKERVKLAREMNGLNRFMLRINRFRNAADHAEWYVWSDWQEGYVDSTGDLLIKPLTARLFADELLFSKAQKVLITSATILDFPTFTRNLGIRSKDAVTLATPSDFSIASRPLFFNPVGSMNRKFIDTTLPKVAVGVEQLLSRYAGKKGIVHTHSYQITRYLTRYLSGTKWANRIVTHDVTKGARDRALARHFDDINEPTVLFSPSMSEGLDLKDELSRFQIVTKVPYPQMTPYIRARMNRDQQWYQWQTALRLVQATGRSVRSQTDRANTHILDSEFANFIGKNNRHMPDYWINSIIW